MQQPEPTTGVVPVHHRIADWLRAEIASGALQPGDAVPSVAELAERWRCSPLTARGAITVLKGEGLLTGGRGRTATVREPPERVRITLETSEEAKRLVLRPRAERQARGTSELTTGTAIGDRDFETAYAVVPSDADLARELGVPEGSEVLRRTYDIRSRATGHRVSWSTSYIPVDLIAGNPDLLDKSTEPWPGGHLHQLYTVGIEVDRFDRTVTAVEPSPGERQQWGMESGVPLLHVRSRSVDVDSRVVEVSDAFYPTDRTEIVFTEHLPRWPSDHPRYDRAADAEADAGS